MLGQRFAAGVAIACAALALCCTSCCTRQSEYESPESFIVDEDTGTYYVSNLNRATPKSEGGTPKADDENGYITTLDKDLNIVKRTFIESGQDGVTLNDPRGLAIVGDTLWVADKKDLRGFDKTTGKSTATIGLKAHGAIQLCSIAVGPNGDLFVSDTGANIIFRVATGGSNEEPVLAEGEALCEPKGLYWDDGDGLLYVACWKDSVILTVDAEGEISTFVSAPDDFMHLDGIDRAANGDFYVSDYYKGVVYRVTPELHIEAVVDKLKTPADISLDRGNNRLLIPLKAENTVTTHDLAGD